MAETSGAKTIFRRPPKIWSEFVTSEFLRIAVDAYQAAGKNKKGLHKKMAAELNDALTANPNEIPVTVEPVTAKYDTFKKNRLFGTD